MCKIKIIATLIMCCFFGNASLNACGGTFYACGSADVLAHGTDFYSNCSTGDRITVVDICHPAEQNYSFWLYEHNE